jgi:hypothetical protein
MPAHPCAGRRLAKNGVLHQPADGTVAAASSRRVGNRGQHCKRIGDAKDRVAVAEKRSGPAHDPVPTANAQFQSHSGDEPGGQVPLRHGVVPGRLGGRRCQPHPLPAHGIPDPYRTSRQSGHRVARLRGIEPARGDLRARWAPVGTRHGQHERNAPEPGVARRRGAAQRWRHPAFCKPRVRARARRRGGAARAADPRCSHRARAASCRAHAVRP